MTGPDNTESTDGLDDFSGLFREICTWQRWGPDDERGTLNELTPERVARAAGEIRSGRTVSMAAPIEVTAGPDNGEPPTHDMTSPGPIGPSGALRFATDHLGMNVHGDAHTHLDALCHVVYDGVLYNGMPASTLTPVGASALSVDAAANGIVGRGVLLDVPAARDVPWLEPGEHVTAADLERAEAWQDVRVGAGDIVCVRVGHRRRRNELGAWDVANNRAGLHPEAVRLLADRHVAVLGSDGNNDSAPSPVAGVPFPVHVLAINAMGLPLIDYLQLDDLAAVCAELGRWSFFCVLAPLRLPTGTGSPANPIAVL